MPLISFHSMRKVTDLSFNINKANSGELNASWNTEANNCMCHIILCFEVILSVTFQLFGMQKNGVITA